MPGRVPIMPQTPYGRLGLSAAVVGIILFLMWSILGPLGAWPGFGMMAVGGGLALIGIVTQRDRGLVTFALLIPLAFTIGFVIADVLFGQS